MISNRSAILIALFASAVGASAFAGNANTSHSCEAALTRSAVDYALGNLAQKQDALLKRAIESSRALAIYIPASTVSKIRTASRLRENAMKQYRSDPRVRDEIKALHDQIESLLVAVIDHPKNDSVFKKNEYASYIRSYSPLSHLTQIPLEVRIRSVVGLTAYAHSRTSSEQYEGIMDLDRDIQEYTQSHYDYLNLQAAKKKELGRLTAHQIRERQRYLREAATDIRKRFLKQAKLPNLLESLVERLMASPIPKLGESNEGESLIASIEAQLNQTTEEKWHLSSFIYEYPSILGLRFTDELKRQALRQRLIEANQSKFLPQDAAEALYAIEAELNTISTVISLSRG